MGLVKSSQLLELRVKKAVTLINQLRDENRELEERLKLVLNHNEELQVLLDKNSSDSKEIEAALESANLALDSLEGLDDFAIDGGDNELDFAEQFTIDGGSAGGDVEELDTVDLSDNF
jgi:hypothetical protein